MPVVIVDGTSRLFIEIDTGGDNEILTEDVYSDWKRWVRGVYEFSTLLEVNNVSDTIFIEAHGLYTGQEVVYTNTGSDNIGLIQSAIYFVRVINNDNIELYDTKLNAEASLSLVGRQDLSLGSGELHILAADNSKFLQAFSVVGGDPISTTESLGSTFFFENLWRIRPSERSHKLTVVGNGFTREAGQSIYVPTVGAFTVNAETRVSDLTKTLSTSTDTRLLLQAVYIDVINGSPGVGEVNGTPNNPVDNLTDALTILNANSLFKLVVRNFLVLDQDVRNINIVGENRNSINFNGYDVTGSTFNNCILAGTKIGSIAARNCELAAITNLSGEFLNCVIVANSVLETGTDTLLNKCSSNSARPQITSAANCNLQVSDFSGALKLTNIRSDNNIEFDGDPGTLELDSTTEVGASIILRGSTFLDDQGPQPVGVIQDERFPNVTDFIQALEFQGYTTVRAQNLDNLDAAISSRSIPGDLMNLTSESFNRIRNLIIVFG